MRACQRIKKKQTGCPFMKRQPPALVHGERKRAKSLLLSKTSLTPTYVRMSLRARSGVLQGVQKGGGGLHTILILILSVHLAHLSAQVIMYARTDKYTAWTHTHTRK
jgi:hypothetical protein